MIGLITGDYRAGAIGGIIMLGVALASLCVQQVFQLPMWRWNLAVFAREASKAVDRVVGWIPHGP